MEIRNLRSFSIQPMGDNAEQVLKKAIASLKVPYWMSAGTALGLYRDGERLCKTIYLPHTQGIHSTDIWLGNTLKTTH